MLMPDLKWAINMSHFRPPNDNCWQLCMFTSFDGPFVVIVANYLQSIMSIDCCSFYCSYVRFVPWATFETQSMHEISRQLRATARIVSTRIELSLGSSRTVAAASVRHKLNQLNNKKQYMFVSLHTPFDKV